LNILFIGDIQGQKSIEKLGRVLPEIKNAEKADIVIINGENSADGNGITPFSANMLFDIGADVITTGNHAFKRKEIYQMFCRRSELIRPANYGENCPGKGIRIIDFGYCSVAVINIIGSVYMSACDNPFKCVDALLPSVKTRCVLVDFHAEATAEKKAMGFYLSGRVSAVLGTHTHVQTADERILEGHTAYITDVGMTGAADSIIGAKKNLIAGFVDYYPQKRFVADGDCEMNAVLVEIDTRSGKALSIKRIIRRI